MINNILVAIDGSPSAEKALDTAAELAKATGAKLTITHVLLHGEPPKGFERMAQVEHLIPVASDAVRPFVANVPATMTTIMKAAQFTEGLQRVIGALGDRLVADAAAKAKRAGAKKVETNIRMGDYANSILAAAKDAKADMIVVGSRGLGPVKRLLIGSVSNKLLQLASCTVVVAR